MAGKRILVVGAGGTFGIEIVRKLRALGHAVTATYRTPRPDAISLLKALGADTEQVDLEREADFKDLLGEADAALLTPVLTVSKAASAFMPDHIPATFFSSNNVAIDFEADVYARLRLAETEVHENAPHAVILRPTMIYGYPGDGNMARLVSAMRRYPITPMPGQGRALQQPVYYKDLADIACRTVLGEVLPGKVCAVSGPEPVTQKALFQAAAAAAGARPLIAPTPAKGLSFLIRAVERSGLKPPLSSAQLARADQDKTPRGAPMILGKTPLIEGLKALAHDLDAAAAGA